MTLCASMALIPFLRGKTVLRFVRPRFHMAMIRQIIACGLPSFLNNIAGAYHFNPVKRGSSSGWAVRRRLSIYGALMYVDGFVQPVMYGACDSLQPAVGYNWGAGKFSRVRALERCCFVAAAVICGGAVAVISLFPSQLVHLFMSDAAGDILATADFAMRLFALTYLTRWVAFATQSYMLAIEKPLQASHYLGLDGPCLPAALDCRPLAAGPHRHLAQLRRHGGAGGGPLHRHPGQGPGRC